MVLWWRLMIIWHAGKQIQYFIFLSVFIIIILYLFYFIIIIIKKYIFKIVKCIIKQKYYCCKLNIG